MVSCATSRSDSRFGRDVGADEAAQIGLVSKTVPDDQLMEEATAYARMIYAGYRMLERFSWERAVRGYRRIYDLVCE